MVTSVGMNKAVYHANSNALKQAWSTPYSDGQDPWLMGRLGPGAGSSPTLMEAWQDDDTSAAYVIITDGATSPMSILAFETSDGVLVASAPVDFGDAAGLGANVTSEQSVVVTGGRAAVVNNYVVDQVGRFCGEIFAALPINDVIKHSCPMMFGKHAFGVQQFQMLPAGGGPAGVSLFPTWVNTDVSCTSSIPGVSVSLTGPETLYCLGHRRASFTVEAMDWLTGHSFFHEDLGHSLAWNSQYAGTEIGDHDDIVMGVMTGVLRVSARRGGRGARDARTAAADEAPFVLDEVRKLGDAIDAGTYKGTDAEALAELRVLMRV